MLLTLTVITSNSPPATDLGYLLHKHPDRVQEEELSVGRAHIFYPEASETCCTAALLLEIDPIALVRGRSDGDSGPLDQYVNDRPYVASSFMSVALARTFSTAMSGRCAKRPDLEGHRWSIEARLSVVPCRGGEALVRRLFEPLGYQVNLTPYILDETRPEWGESSYFTVVLRAETTVAEILSHLYVLIPVLDARKHYYVGDDEVEKLVRRGEGWLSSHPEREMIAIRYFKHRKGLARTALERICADDGEDPDEASSAHAIEEEQVERPLSLNEQRLAVVVREIADTGARSVLDLGCGEGKLMRVLMEKRFDKITGVDASHTALERAADRLQLDRLAPQRRQGIQLLHGSLTYRDRRLMGYDAAAVVEVIEHLEPERLAAFERILFECERPGAIVITTPNAEYNVHFADLPAGRFRHKDHRFEWTRAEFRAWSTRNAERFGYGVRFVAIGPEDAVTGPPTQMAVFRLSSSEPTGAIESEPAPGGPST